MFGKMGELKKMYDKYRSLQKVLKKLVIRGKEWSYTGFDGTVVDGAVVLDISGEMKLTDFSKEGCIGKVLTEAIDLGQAKGITEDVCRALMASVGTPADSWLGQSF